jgi:PEP-CTERM motif
MKIRLVSGILAAAAIACATSAHADIGITDPAGDFLLPTYAGALNGDLDVRSAFVTYDSASDSFFLSGTVGAPIGTTPTAFYVWGFDRGQGTQRFVTPGSTFGVGVSFDSVVIFRLDGSATVSRLVGGGSDVLPGAVSFSGATFSATIAASLLPSLGLADSAYTWNLWPRDGAVPAAAGNAAIADFAPDAANAVVVAVPEPGSYALFALGLGCIGWLRRGRRFAPEGPASLELRR